MVEVEEVVYKGVILEVQNRRRKTVYLIQTVETEFAVSVARTHCLSSVDVKGARKILEKLPPYGPRESFTERKKWDLMADSKAKVGFVGDPAGI